MPDDFKILQVGTVSLIMPDGCEKELFFTFIAPGERLTLSSYKETNNLSPIDVAAKRLEVAREVVSENIKVIVQKPGTLEGMPTSTTILQSKENDGQTSTLCQFLVKESSGRFLDINYQFLGNSRGSQEDFETIVKELKMVDLIPSTNAPTDIVLGWKLLKLASIHVKIPTRLKRSTPYTFSDSAKNINWCVDSQVLGSFDNASNETIPSDPSNSMSIHKTEPFSSNNVSGTITLITTTDPESGKAGERIVRGEVVVTRRTKVVLRGRGPESAGEKLNGDLKFILSSLTLNEK